MNGFFENGPFAKVMQVFFGLYCVSLVSSIAAMEATTAVIALMALYLFVQEMRMGSCVESRSKGSLMKCLEPLRLTPGLRFGVDFWLGIYFVVVFVGAVLAAENLSNFHQMVKDVRWIALFYLLAYGMRRMFRPETAKTLVTMMSVLLVIVGVYALAQLLFGIELFRSRKVLAQWGDYYRAVGFFNMPLTFAYVIGMPTLVILSYSLLHFGRRDWKSLVLPSLAGVLGVVSVVVSLTRGAWLAMLVSGLVALLIVARKRVVVSGILIMGVVFAALVQNPLISVRLSSVGDFKSQTYMDRWALAQANWEMFKDHPILGVGLHQNYKYVDSYYEKLGIDYTIMNGHAHNNIMQFLGGIGSLGVMAYLGFSLGFILLSIRLFRRFGEDQLLYKALALGILLAQIFFHVGGLSECNFMDAEVKHMLIFWWSILIFIWYDSSSVGFNTVDLNTMNLNKERLKV